MVKPADCTRTPRLRLGWFRASLARGRWAGSFDCGKGSTVRHHRSGLLRVLIFLIGILLCVLVTRLIWPGFTVGDQFRSYPVTAPLLAVVASIWLVILGLTFLVLRAMRKE